MLGYVVQYKIIIKNVITIIDMTTIYYTVLNFFKKNLGFKLKDVCSIKT